MRRTIKRILVGLLLICLSPGLYGIYYGTREVPRGVNDSGAEWDLDRPLSMSSYKTVDYVAAQGFNVIRLPLRWEGLQPVLFGELDRGALDDVRGYLERCHRAGLRVILDVHNSARYAQPSGGKLAPRAAVIGDAELPIAAFADLWSRISGEFQRDGRVYAYDLMNEPHDIVTQTWKDASQAAVDAIRARDDGHFILIPGSQYSACAQWLNCQGHYAWIRDRLNHHAYEAHIYFDHASGGTYDWPFATEAARDPNFPSRARTHLAYFSNWCFENGVRGFVGELGCPPTPEWCAYLDDLLSELDRTHLGWAGWSLGERWSPDYLLSLQPDASFQRHRPQLEIMRRHLRRAGLVSDFCLGYEICYRRAYFAARWVRDKYRSRRTTT